MCKSIIPKGAKSFTKMSLDIFSIMLRRMLLIVSFNTWMTRNLLLDALDEALEELPAAQREAFVAHELMGRSFKDISAETGLSVNTLLSRKRYAVLHLRQRLQSIYESYARK